MIHSSALRRASARLGTATSGGELASAPPTARAFHSSRPAAFRPSSPSHSALADTFNSLVPALQALPPTIAPYLPGPLASYPITTSLVLLTLTLRSTVTLPVALWQRARSRRMARDVYPIWEQMKKDLPLQVRTKCRRAGKSYEQFRVELQVEMKKALRDLLRKHRCTPLPTMLAPLAVQIPLFITISYLIREACVSPEFTQELLPWSTWSFTGPSLAEQQQLDAFAQSASILRDRGMNEETLSNLMGPKGGGASGGGLGTTLAQKDSSMQGPVVLGLITLLNAELTAHRAKQEREHLHSGSTPSVPVDSTPEASSPFARQSTPLPGARSVAPPTVKATRDYRPAGDKRHASTKVGPPSPSSSPKEEVDTALQAEERTSLRSTILINTLRAAAVAFVPISSQIPGGLLIYWLTSATYTLAQNAILDWRERKERERDLVGPAASSSSPPRR
ncbi:unnamed protein product [Tilletia laevis]|uniref:Uncharacterized protein n=3 Tax=Tilletia TaxID=13289 RepID=A0A8X7MQF5_9BASI|nr:hypothetical protein CF336_g7276 [Tilletia laevis]KAE8192869.1 hypothetical protein CF328_g5220 [Tilletia controversa]KAE8256995.1 hypothetical protein A4X03_0g4851 [Tilletia caries]KAE8243971.1 hypothetical protein A4X06_0g6033 [Tilletia controversa]CAD6915672.1 unnamed protein product [Tilletia laevis]